MPPINEACFQGSMSHKWLLMAQGFVLDRSGKGKHVMSAGSNCVERNGGIANPQKIHLKLGTTYFRFADSIRERADRQKAVYGGWWIDYDTLARMVHFAHEAGLDFGYVLKLWCAVPYEWGESNRIVSAELQSPLLAWAGPGRRAEVTGKSARDGGAGYTPPQDVVQMFIPGMDQYGAAAFPDVDVEYSRDSSYIRGKCNCA